MKRYLVVIILLGSSLLFFGKGYAAQPKERIQSIQTTGNKFIDAKTIYSYLKLKQNDIYSDQLLEKSTEAILKLYEENGFPFCQIDLEDFNRSLNLPDSAGWLSFKLRITEGPRVRIRNIEFVGDKTTREGILKRMLDIDSSSYFSQAKLESGLSALRRASFIKAVKSAQLVPEPDPTWSALRIELEEKRQNSFLGVLGYVPKAQSGTGYFSGSLNFVFDNIFGTGRKGEIDWSKKDPYSFDLFFSYREPYLFNLPLSAQLDLRQIDYDSSYLKLDITTRFDYSASGKIILGFSTGWEKVTADERLKTVLPSSRKYKLGMKLSLDLLDTPYNPRKGIYDQAEIIYGRKNYYSSQDLNPDQGSSNEAKILLDLDGFLPVQKEQVIALSLHLRDIQSSEKVIPISDQFYLGGLNSLRGYREEEFSGDKLFWSNLEYRLILSPESRAYLFWDFGHFSRMVENAVTGSLDRLSGSRSGFGLGLKVDTKLGVYEVDYALGEKDSFSHGKIHFGISNRF
ncbi:MAG TPA: BamA/TamA family outer membrane protein [Terriglobales bacterium]|nr:BamA/TamA family outer membrane protein [Terriglobales bacterium]